MTNPQPNNNLHVLLLENIHYSARVLFKKQGYSVETLEKSLSQSELLQKIKNVCILGIRSRTNITDDVVKNAPHLMAIGAFCIGTNQIDLNACLKNGIAVFNAPYSNTRSVVELVLGEIIMLMRGVFDKSVKLHQYGKWDKLVTGSSEVRGKKLGIIGYGNIGSQLSVIAESLGMDVYYYDIVDKLALGNAKKCESMEQVLKIADIITIHVDGREENKGLISEKEFKTMKDGAIFLNLSRGSVVDISALAKYVKNKKIKGAGIDVYPQEPKSMSEKFKSQLQGLHNVILTPHIGGSTQEAQKNIAEFVHGKLIEYIKTGSTMLSVNFPNMQLPQIKNAHRLIHIHKNVPGILAKINSILAKQNINIVGQYLKTNEALGYAITDISKKYNKDVIGDLQNIPHTIKLRVLY